MSEIINCLKCNEPFESVDRKTNRICRKCSKKNTQIQKSNSFRLNLDNKVVRKSTNDTM